uniref:High-affinity zinc uptake system protein ZnuA n=1 Tax=Candidatus Kentrum sp. FW TaxID=2126338 RepID=A0A450RUF2_9GAMM|nr:MAG: zinc transport system substrate-binding protein [Candidatus Kentron sp. FW]
MPLKILFAMGISLMLAHGPWAQAVPTPRVVVSILPIHSLVSGVMQGTGTPTLIVKGYGSPHTYRMRPSVARVLHSADLIFWVGPTLETFLRKPLSALPKTTRVIALLEIDGLTLIGNRRGGSWEGHSHSHQQFPDDHPHSGGNHSPLPEATQLLGYNPHIWLHPGNVRQLIKAIARELSRLDPPREARYRANAEAVLRRIGGLEAKIRTRLSPLEGIPYLVFHDAFAYLERHYRLRAVGSITASPEQIPGARRIVELRATVRRLGVRCIFREPQFNAKLIETTLQDTGVNIGDLDPLGIGIPSGPDHWFSMMEGISEGMVGCLGTGQGDS